MKTFSIVEQALYLVSAQRDPNNDNADVPRVRVEFSTDPANSAICRMRITPPDGAPDGAAAIECEFNRNGLMVSQVLQDTKYAPWDRRPLAVRDAEIKAGEEIEVDTPSSRAQRAGEQAAELRTKADNAKRKAIEEPTAGADAFALKCDALARHAENAAKLAEDEAGNEGKAPASAQPDEYDANGNLIVRGPQYDESGNLLHPGSQAVRYDAAGNPIGTNDPRVAQQYDEAGNLVSPVHGNVNTTAGLANKQPPPDGVDAAGTPVTDSAAAAQSRPPQRGRPSGATTPARGV